MARFNGDINLDGVLIFPSGADDRMAIRSIATESTTGQSASGQIRFVSVGNEEGYWYLQNNPTAGLFDFDAGSFPSGQRIATLADLVGLGGGGSDAGQTSINGLSGVVLVTSPDGTILIGDNGQAIELSGLFTPASGAVLQQKCEDIITLSGSIGSLALDDLTDVTVTSPALGELLTFNGTTWVNQASSGMVTTMVRVASTTVFTDTDVVSFSGLDGNVDKRYQLICEFVDSLGNTSEVSYRLTFNDDHTVTNYGWSEIISNDTGLAAASENAGDQDGIRIAFNNTGGDSTKNLSHAIVDILAQAGLPRLVQCSNTRPGASGSIDTEGVALVHGRWSNLESNITEINITASTAGNDIGSGTRLTLYAEQDVDLNNTFLPVDARAVTGSIVPDTSGIYDLGTKSLKYANVHSVSGIFGSGTTTVSDNLIVDYPNTLGRGVIINCRNPTYADTALLIDVDRSGSTAFNHILALTNGAADAVFQVDGEGRILNRALRVDPLTTQQAIEIDQETGHNAQSVLSTARNTSYSSIMHFIRCARVANSAYNFLLTQSDPFGTPDTQHILRGDGGLFSDIAAATPADYAEYFECANPSGIRAGYPVSINPQGKIRISASGSDVIGFVSAAPAYIADAAWGRWQDKYRKNDFGGHIKDRDGNKVLNPAWNSGLAYVSREDRAEWVTVGLVGKLWVRHYGEIVRPGDYVALGVSGMVHKATNEPTQWLVIERGRNFNDKRGYGTTRILFR